MLSVPVLQIWIHMLHKCFTAATLLCWCFMVLYIFVIYIFDMLSCHLIDYPIRLEPSGVMALMIHARYMKYVILSEEYIIIVPLWLKCELLS